MQKERKPNGYWNIYDNCYEAAKQCTSRTEFQKKYRAAYKSALRNNWLEYTWFESKQRPSGYWNVYEHCYDAAKECSSLAEFRKKYYSGYNSAKEHGWLDDFTWLEQQRQPNGYWDNYERCYEAAKQCKSRKELQKKSKGAYGAARRNNWLKDYTWFESKYTPAGFWENYSNCYEAAKECKSRTEFCKKYPTAYKNSLKNNWIDNFTWLKRKLNPYIDNLDNVYGYFFIEQHAVYIGRTINLKRRHYEHQTLQADTVYKFAIANNIPVPEVTILETGLTPPEGVEREDYHVKKYSKEGWLVLNIAKTGANSGSLGGIGTSKWNKKTCRELALECKTRTEFHDKNQQAYTKALTKGWINDYTWLAPSASALKWEYDACYNAAKQCKTRTEFSKKYGRAYYKARKNGWLKDYTWFITTRKPVGYWNIYHHCYEEARKYKTRMEFEKECGTAYKVACKNKWLDNFTWLNGKVNNSYKSKSVKQLTLHGELVKTYPSIMEIERQTGWHHNNISKCCQGKRKSAYGYRWEYVEQ